MIRCILYYDINVRVQKSYLLITFLEQTITKNSWTGVLQILIPIVKWSFQEHSPDHILPPKSKEKNNQNENLKNRNIEDPYVGFFMQNMHFTAKHKLVFRRFPQNSWFFSSQIKDASSWMLHFGPLHPKITPAHAILLSASGAACWYVPTPPLLVFNDVISCQAAGELAGLALTGASVNEINHLMLLCEEKPWSVCS